VQCRKNLNEVLMVATLVAINADGATVGSGRICVWQESGVRQSVLCWCVWQESDFSCHDVAFTFNLI
jgi:hypothetical protein